MKDWYSHALNSLEAAVGKTITKVCQEDCFGFLFSDGTFLVIYHGGESWVGPTTSPNASTAMALGLYTKEEAAADAAEAIARGILRREADERATFARLKAKYEGKP